jgi:hypothetical protein
MDQDQRLNSQLRTLGKKLFQFRELVAKIEIPEKLPSSPHDKLFWNSFVTKCSAAVTVLRQVHSALTPDMYHLAVFPGEKIWRNPAAVPDLLGMPERVAFESPEPIACSREEALQWNAKLDEVNTYLESVLENQLTVQSNTQSFSRKEASNLVSASEKELLRHLFNSSSASRVVRYSLFPFVCNPISPSDVLSFWVPIRA